MGVYGMDFRRKVLAALEQGHPVSSVADRFDIDQKTVRSYGNPPIFSMSQK